VESLGEVLTPINDKKQYLERERGTATFRLITVSLSLCSDPIGEWQKAQSGEAISKHLGVQRFYGRHWPRVTVAA
jgi:hypothetical protein